MPIVFPAAGKALEYNRDIRPILSENCFACHGPDAASRKAKLRLDRLEDAIALRKNSRPAITPGQPDASELVHRIFTEEADDLMPPPETHKSLTAGQKILLRQWIVEGANYQPHWAYRKIVRPKAPIGTAWLRNPIDGFILQNLLAQNVKPSSEAPKHALLRRLSLDLTGLPPTLEELNSFLRDKSSRAYERQVDRLLASPHFGERMAVAWLDLVRFADSTGYHGDQTQNTFPYRDYVIDSFNRNKSFAQFTVEQIAGDLLPHSTSEQKIASCFNRLNMMTREGGTQPKEYLHKYTADRVRTVSSAWLGSTMGCAECHDHKYDPISTRDFYAMGAFFADIKQWGIYAEYLPYNLNPELSGLDFDHHPFPPEIEVENRYLQQRQARLLREVEETLAVSAKKLKHGAREKDAFEQWRRAALEFREKNPTGWLVPKPEVSFKMKDAKAAGKDHFTLEVSGAISFTDKPKENIQITIPVSGWIAALRLEVVPHKNASYKKHQWTLQGASIVLSARWKSGTNSETSFSFLHAEADRKADNYEMSVHAVGVKNRWRTTTNQEVQTAVYILDKPFEAGPNDALVLNLGNAGLASVRVSVSPLAASEPLDSGFIASAFAQELARKRLSKNVNTTYFFSTGWDKDAFSRVKDLKQKAWECREGRGLVMVTEACEPITIRVLPRGNWQDESGEIMLPATPHFLPRLANPENRRLDRLDLARWIISPENPLTARTFVNRTWKQFFGMGISAVVDDLGAQGEWPAHPELLDWLSAEFIESGWDMKHLIKLMVMSATYRQETNERPELIERDPNNRWLSFQSPRRLDAEFVRDNALAIAGLLNRDIGGPSARPYQPADYYANIQFPNRDWHAETDERQYRRGLYTHWQRSFLHPMLANFDAPAREECTAMRAVSNTPQQGLTLLNDPTFVEAARGLAQRLLSVPRKTDLQRMDLAYAMALARTAKGKERESLVSFLARQRAHYAAHPEEAEKLSRVGIAQVASHLDKKELAAWTNLCRVLLNLHETITRY